MKEILNFNNNVFLFVKINYIISKKTSSLTPQRSLDTNDLLVKSSSADFAVICLHNDCERRERRFCRNPRPRVKSKIETRNM